MWHFKRDIIAGGGVKLKTQYNLLFCTFID